METTDVEREYSELLAQERTAWSTLRQNMRGAEYDPALLAEWLAIGRKCEAARQRMIDAVLQDDPGVMHRPLPAA